MSFPFSLGQVGLASLTSLVLSFLAFAVATMAFLWTRARTLPEVVVQDVTVRLGAAQPAPDPGFGPQRWFLDTHILVYFKNTGDVAASIPQFRVDHYDSGRDIQTNYTDTSVVNPMGPGSTFDRSFSYEFLHEAGGGMDLEGLDVVPEGFLDEEPHFLLISMEYEPRRPLFPECVRNLLGLGRRPSQFVLRYSGGDSAALMTTEEDLEEAEVDPDEVIGHLGG